MAEGVPFLALDGGRAHITTELATVTPRFTSVADAEIRRLGALRQAFTSGVRELGEQVAFDPSLSVDMRIDEEYGFQGGKLRLGWGIPPVGPDGAEYWEIGPDGVPRRHPFRIAFWEGESFSLRTHQYGGESADLIAMFDQFQIRDTSEGIILIPNEPKQTLFVKGPKILKDIPEIGLLDIYQLTERTVKEVPSHHGTPVEGGELFVDGAGTDHPFFLLVSDTSLTEILPHPRLDPIALVNQCANIVVQWEAA